MKKIYFLLILFCVLFDTYAQQNNSRLNVKSLKLIENDTEASRTMKKDKNGDKCALIKIQTPNMNEAERNRLQFQADMGTFVYDDKTAVGEVKIFLTEGCKTLIIMHPDYGKLNYAMPLTLEGWKTYEMVLMADKDDTAAPKTISLNSNYVIINVTPKDALINVDGKLCTNGKVNLTVDEPHHLEVSHKLYHTYEMEIHASETEKLKYDVNLAPAFGWLKIDSKPESGAIVLIDGERKGMTPFTSDTLPSGEYEVKLMKDMYETGTFTVVVKDSQTQEIELPIKPTFSQVTVTTDSESDIFIDGEKKDKGKWQGRLLEGTHILEARKISHRTTVVKLDVIVGKNESVVINNPVPIYGALDIQSDPDEAEVYLDGVKIGETPLKKNDVLVGNRTIRFEKKGCATLTKSYKVEEGNIISIYEKLDSGKIITVTTGREGDEILVDGTFAGHSPLDVSMGYGRHTVKAMRNGKSVEKSFDVRENGGESSLNLTFFRNQTITVNGVSFEMVYVEGGSFDMGATSEQVSDAYDSEKPVHRVTLSDYYIGKCEVTQELWEAVMGSNPSRFKGAQNPVDSVSWYDCQEFVSRLNSLTGRTFRLPTEAEWEYAARGGNKSLHYKYSGSDNIDDVAWYWKNSGDRYLQGTDSDWDWGKIINNNGRTHAVGTKTANELGIYDMSGNVREWCSDWYCYYSAGAQTNPQGPSSGSIRVLRGGIWSYSARSCRVSSRNSNAPVISNSDFGLRLVLVPNEVPSIPQQQEQYSPQQEYGGGFSNQTITVNGVSFEMVYVEGGSFDMGATSEQGSEAQRDEKPVHRVTLSDYYIGKCEVTQKLWKAVMGSNPSLMKGAKKPVEYVSWNDCQEFISRLNSLTGRTFRLPTEAEWEYAARGGKKSRHYKYSGSDNIDDVAWYGDNSGCIDGRTHAVGTKSPNELGIYDMSGNVYEWCSDWYGDYSAGAQTNPQGPSSGYDRVLRGGTWHYDARNCRVSYRDFLGPLYSFNGSGLRLVLVP